MLILTRRPCQTIMIGSEVTITVLGVVGNQVRIGINAPKNVPVHRKEIYERIKRENQGGEPGTLDEQRPGAKPVAAGGVPVDTPRPTAQTTLRLVHSSQCDCQLCMDKRGVLTK